MQTADIQPAARAWHECDTVDEFRARFAEATGHTVQDVIDQTVSHDAPKAVFLTGSLPLGMATKGSDVDFVVLVDSKEALRPESMGGNTFTNRQLAFANEGDSLRAGLFITVMSGITVEVAVIVTSTIDRIYRRLRSPNPELSEVEIMTLGRLRTGWLLSESPGYLESRGASLSDPVLDVYCSVKHFLFALTYRHKALHALQLADVPQALQLGRLSVEMAFLAYFAAEGFPYLGPKWLAQLGHARGAAERLRRHPQLKENVRLLFPAYGHDTGNAKAYLDEASSCLTSMRNLIEQKTLFRIAYKACRQIYPIT